MDERSGLTEQEAGTRTFATLTFIDLCGSTKLADLDPDVYDALLRTLRREAREIVRRHDGIVSQVYGDGMLVVFQGAGGSDRALAATLAIHRAAGEIAVPPGARMPRLLMHSGIHSGLVLLRSGSHESGRVETIGRATGVAARLSAAAGPDEILVSRGTLGPTGGGLRFGPVRYVEVSGAGDRVAAVPVLGTMPGGVPLRNQVHGRRTPFLGRDDIIDAVAARLLAPERLTPQCVAVVGPPGQGKSRLSEEFELRARATPAAVLRGAAALGEFASTLQPFREIDAAAARILSEEPHSGEGDNLAGLSQAVVCRLRRLAERLAVVLILDDWQWADSASLQLLAELRHGPAAVGILILAREPSPGELPIAADVAIGLPPITESASVALIGRLRPELDLLDRTRASRLAGGNPLYLEELCLLSVRVLGGLLTAEPNHDEIGRVAAIIEARVRALPPDLAQVLQTAAVVGGDCAVWILEGLCGVTADSPKLAKLSELDLLIPSLTPGSVRFKHGITRNVVYQLVHLETRRALHREVAELVELHDAAAGADRDELLAWHCYESGQFERAIAHAERAGDRAVAAASIDRAQLHYSRALNAIEQLPEDAGYADRMRIIGKYGHACVYDSDRHQLAVFERAAEVAAARGDREGEARSRFWHGYVCHGSGQARRAVAEIRRAIDLSNAGGESQFGVQLQATLGQALAAAGRYDQAAPVLDKAIEAKRAHRSGRNVSAGMAYSLALKAAVLGDTGRFAEAHAAVAEALGLLAGQRHPVEGSVMGWSAAVHYWQGDWEGLLETANRGCNVALRIETVYIHAISRAFASYARWRLTGAEAAADELVHAVACMAGQGKELALSIAYGCLADMEATRGNEAAAHAAVRHAYVRAREGEPHGMAVAARARARLLALSDPDRARRMLAHARGNARRRSAPHEFARCDLEEAELGLVAGPTAAARLADAAAAFERMRMTGAMWHARALMSAARVPPGLSRRA